LWGGSALIGKHYGSQSFLYHALRLDLCLDLFLSLEEEGYRRCQRGKRKLQREIASWQGALVVGNFDVFVSVVVSFEEDLGYKVS
jgi:hypothetical protein